MGELNRLDLDQFGIIIYSFPKLSPPEIGIDTYSSKIRFAPRSTVVETEVAYKREDDPLNPDQMTPQALKLEEIINEMPHVLSVKFYTSAVYAVINPQIDQFTSDQISLGITNLLLQTYKNSLVN